MPTDALLDVNITIASIFADHVHHFAARRFVDQVERFYTTPTIQGGFLRFATRPLPDENKNPQPPRLTMMEAHSKLAHFVSFGVFLSDDAQFTELSLRSMRGHRQWTDAYLLHLARKHGLNFATLDRRMASLDDPKNPVLFVVA